MSVSSISMTLPDKDWVKVDAAGSHWRDGFRVARPVLEAECLVSTGCLKTHQFGGVFTMSLKLHVGVVPTTRNGYDYMAELHGSPHQQELIAEINAPFAPDLVVLDGIDAFVDQGPATGKRVRGDVVLASTDRVAIDAAGVAVLKVSGKQCPDHDTPDFRSETDRAGRGTGVGGGVSGSYRTGGGGPGGSGFP